MHGSQWQAVCRKCGRTYSVSDDDTVQIAEKGWPICCTTEMTILYFLERLCGIEQPDKPNSPD